MQRARVIPIPAFRIFSGSPPQDNSCGAEPAWLSHPYHRKCHLLTNQSSLQASISLFRCADGTPALLTDRIAKLVDSDTRSGTWLRSPFEQSASASL